MYSPAKSALPPLIRAELETFGTELAEGRADRGKVQAIRSQLDHLPPASISRIDSEIAYLARMFHQPREIRVVPSLLSRLPSFTRELSHSALLQKTAGLEYLFIFHRDGWLREAALNRISAPPSSPFYFAAVSYRLNDWVPQVRSAAKACAERIFSKAAPALAARSALFLLERRQVWSRWDDEASVLDEVFARQEVVDELAAILLTAVTGPMGRIFRQSLRQPQLDRHLTTLAREATMPAVRVVALQTLLDGSAQWPIGFKCQWIDKSLGISRRVTDFAEREIERTDSLESLLETGAQDRSAAVRRVAASGLIRHRSTISNADAIIQLLRDDRSSAVRERVQFVLDDRLKSKAQAGT